MAKKAPQVSVSISMPPADAKKAMRAAHKSGLSRSAFIVEAIHEKIERERAINN
jgi:predicted transcriptional regulator